MGPRRGVRTEGTTALRQRPLAALALLAVAAILAGGCGGASGPSAEPPEVDFDELSEFLSSTSTSAPPDVSDRIVRDDGTVGTATAADRVDATFATAAAAGSVDGAGLVDLGPTETPAPEPDEEATSTSEPADVVAAPDDGPDPEPLRDGPVAPLTGELTTDPNLAQRRALAVKVDNSDRRSRPQAGLAAADVVYEVLIEGAATRFLAVFHSEIPDRVGPVRSSRSSDIDLLTDLATPFLASSGANTTVLREIRQAERAGTLVDIGGLRMIDPYTRDPSRRSPYNLYFHFEDLPGATSDTLPGGALDAPVAPLFEYGSSNPPGLADAAGVTVTYHKSSGNVVSHIWDDSLRGWVRIQEGTLMTTETDFGASEVAPTNVAVVWMPYGTSAADAGSPQVFSFGSGDAFVLTAGAVHDAVWERTEEHPGFRFSDEAGNPLTLSPGSTWLLLANRSGRFPVAEATVVTAADSVRLVAEARAVAYPAGNVVSAS